MTMSRSAADLRLFVAFGVACAGIWVAGFPRGAGAEEAPAMPAIREIGPGVYVIGKLRLDKTANTLTFPGAVQLDKGYLEYLIVTPSGSTHESLLVTPIDPGDLHFAMLLLGAKGAGILTPGPDDKPPAQINAEYLKRAPRLQGDALTITATWTRDGKKKTAPVESWILNKATNKPAESGAWIYTGSMFSSGKFLAQLEGSLAAVVTNPSALINNPRPGSDDDQIWVVNEKSVPPAETPLEITIRLEPGEIKKSAASAGK
jgi:hypothetical protein